MYFPTHSIHLKDFRCYFRPDYMHEIKISFMLTVFISEFYFISHSTAFLSSTLKPAEGIS